MPERIPNDHDSVTSVRATVARSGGTRRPCLRLPADAGLDVAGGDLVRLVLDGAERHARVDEDATGLVVRGAYDNRRLARSDGADGDDRAENRLVEWCEANDRGPDDAVEVDEVNPGYLYGVRVPGKRTVYRATESPDESLSSIAERLSDSDGN